MVQKYKKNSATQAFYTAASAGGEGVEGLTA